MFSELARGLATTLKHIFRKPVTVAYPERRLPLAPRYKGRHFLVQDEDGLERCVGCELCAVACPADAIYIEAAENTDQQRVSHGERYAKVYKIHMLRCIFCGMCEEACPEDAIFMGKQYELASYQRDDFVYGKERLLLPLREAAKQRPELLQPGTGLGMGQQYETAATGGGGGQGCSPSG
ncbi:MAG: NADH-quinone oxidoreductase subunit NuoI [candidate division NC10 bacterium]|nr:NADH-quinone oxidoreductase subunit NuoI [candidate division NC10 bacterium]